MRYIVDPPKSPLKRGTLIYLLYFITAQSAVMLYTHDQTGLFRYWQCMINLSELGLGGKLGNLLQFKMF